MLFYALLCVYIRCLDKHYNIGYITYISQSSRCCWRLYYVAALCVHRGAKVFWFLFKKAARERLKRNLILKSAQRRERALSVSSFFIIATVCLSGRHTHSGTCSSSLLGGGRTKQTAADLFFADKKKKKKSSTATFKNIWPLLLFLFISLLLPR